MKRLSLIVALLLAAAPAHAHKLKLFVAEDGAEVTGKTYFAGGGPAADLPGQVLDVDGRVVASLRTNADGRFRYAPSPGAALRIRFESGDGHMAEAAIGRQPTATAPPATAVAGSDVDAAIARQLIPLREQLDRMESRARLSDITGGIGLIVGVFGLYAWIAARRKEPR